MRLQRKMLVAGMASAIALGALIAPAAQAAEPAIIVWADGDKVDGLKKVAAAYTAGTVTVLSNAATKDNLPKATADGGPDIVIGAHDWIGQFSADGLIVAQTVPALVKKQFAAQTYGAFSYAGTQYGMPMSVENIAWVQNVAIMGKTCPATLDAALATINAYQAKAKKAKKLVEKISIPGDPYHHYPLLSGLGGYNFGQKLNGALDKNKVGLDNDVFLKNVGKFSVWQKSGALGYYNGQGFGLTTNYGKGLAAVAFTGPWNTNDIAALAVRKVNPIKSVLCPFPTIVKGIVSRPFSGVQGLMITKFAGATGHASTTAVQAFVNFAATAAQQNTYAKYAGVIPANLASKASGADAAKTAILAAFKAAGKVSIPMPNIPEAGNMWGAMGTAFSKSLAKTNPSKPSIAWRQAAENLRDAVNA